MSMAEPSGASPHTYMGSFNNYLDMTRWVGGVNVQGKTSPYRGKKKGKSMSS